MMNGTYASMIDALPIYYSCNKYRITHQPSLKKSFQNRMDI